jgi:hypothetical protein
VEEKRNFISVDHFGIKKLKFSYCNIDMCDKLSNAICPFALFQWWCFLSTSCHGSMAVTIVSGLVGTDTGCVSFLLPWQMACHKTSYRVNIYFDSQFGGWSGGLGFVPVARQYIMAGACARADFLTLLMSGIWKREEEGAWVTSPWRARHQWRKDLQLVSLSRLYRLQ